MCRFRFDVLSREMYGLGFLLFGTSKQATSLINPSENMRGREIGECLAESHVRGTTLVPGTYLRKDIRFLPERHLRYLVGG